MYVEFYMSNYHGWNSTFTTTAEEGLSGLPFTWVRKRSQCASTLNILYTRVILFLFEYVYYVTKPRGDHSSELRPVGTPEPVSS